MDPRFGGAAVACGDRNLEEGEGRRILVRVFGTVRVRWYWADEFGCSSCCEGDAGEDGERAGDVEGVRRRKGVTRRLCLRIGIKGIIRRRRMVLLDDNKVAKE